MCFLECWELSVRLENYSIISLSLTRLNGYTLLFGQNEYLPRLLRWRTKDKPPRNYEIDFLRCSLFKLIQNDKQKTQGIVDILLWLNEMGNLKRSFTIGQAFRFDLRIELNKPDIDLKRVRNSPEQTTNKPFLQRKPKMTNLKNVMISISTFSGQIMISCLTSKCFQNIFTKIFQSLVAEFRQLGCNSRFSFQVLLWNIFSQAASSLSNISKLDLSWICYSYVLL